MLFNLDFAGNTILSRFFFFLFIIVLNLLILAAIAQILDSITELVVAIRIPSKKANTEIEIHPVIVETKIRKRSI